MPGIRGGQPPRSSNVLFQAANRLVGQPRGLLQPRRSAPNGAQRSDRQRRKRCGRVALAGRVSDDSATSRPRRRVFEKVPADVITGEHPPRCRDPRREQGEVAAPAESRWPVACPCVGARNGPLGVPGGQLERQTGLSRKSTRSRAGRSRASRNRTIRSARTISGDKVLVRRGQSTASSATAGEASGISSGPTPTGAPTVRGTGLRLPPSQGDNPSTSNTYAATGSRACLEATGRSAQARDADASPRSRSMRFMTTGFEQYRERGGAANGAGNVLVDERKEGGHRSSCSDPFVFDRMEPRSNSSMGQHLGKIQRGRRVGVMPRSAR